MLSFDEGALRAQLLSTHPTAFAEGLASLGAVIRQGAPMPVALVHEVLAARGADPAGRIAVLNALRHAPDGGEGMAFVATTWGRALTDDAVAEVRARAAELLGESPLNARLPLLHALGADADAGVRHAAALALAGFSVPAQLEHLLMLYRDEGDRRVRAGLIPLLARSRDATVLPILLKAIDDEFLRPAVLEALRAHYDFDDLLESEADEGMPTLGARLQGFIGLGPVGQARRLVERVRSIMRSDVDARHRALATACMSYFDAAGPDVLDALDDVAHEVRRAALEVLTTIDCPGATPRLTAMYARDRHLRREVLAALGQQRDATVVSFLSDAYRSAPDDDEARLGAIEGLADLGLAAGLDTLALAMGDPSGWNRNSAAAAIWKVLAFLDVPPDASQTAVVVAALVPALRDAHPHVAHHAARALGVTGSAEAARQMIATLAGADDDLAAQILLALGELKSREALPHLLSIRPGVSFRVLESALTALSRYDDPSLLPALIERMTWPAAGLGAREHLIDRIMLMGGADARKCLIHCLDDDDEFVRERAASALEGYEHPDVLVALCARLRDPTESEDVQLAAGRSLSGLRVVGTLEALKPLLESPLPRVRRGALLAIAGIPGPARLRAIDRALDDEDESVRETAIEIGEILAEDQDATFTHWGPA